MPRLPTHAFAMIALALPLCGCLSANARLAGGPTVTTGGRAGYQVLLSGGLGFGLEGGTSLRSVSAATVNSRTAIGLAQAIELGSVGKRWSWNAGLRFEPVASESGRAHWAYAMLLRSLDYGQQRPSRGKFSLGLRSRRALSAGLELSTGFQFEAGKSTAVSLMPTVDYTVVITD